MLSASSNLFDTRWGLIRNRTRRFEVQAFGTSSQKAAIPGFSVATHVSEALHIPKEVASHVALQLIPCLNADSDMMESRIDHNLELMQELCGSRAGAVVIQSPTLLSADLATWFAFLEAFGVPLSIMAKICSESPTLFAKGDVHTAGTTILFFKSMGFRNEDIIRRVINLYPFLLAKDLHRDIQPVVDYLQQAGCCGENLRLLTWEYPRIFDKDYRRQVRKFQYLSVYGLTPSKCTFSANEKLMMR